MTFNFSSFVRTFSTALASALLLAMAAQAHEGDGKPQYGGIIAESAAFQAEMVIKQNTVTIYLTDHGKVLSSKGATGKLTVLSAGKTQSVTLSPAANNQLQATLAEPIKSGKFVAQISLLGKPAAAVRFEVK